jgi:hypothetical protein
MIYFKPSIFENFKVTLTLLDSFGDTYGAPVNEKTPFI